MKQPAPRTDLDPIALDKRLLELCRAEHGSDQASVGIRRLARSPVDVRMFFPNSPTQSGETGRSVLEDLRSSPWVESARRKGSTLSIRLSEEFIVALGEDLERGPRLHWAHVDALAGRSYIVNFLNPNATKPLHVGHLRNVTIGMALAASLEACGSRVVRQCYVCDIGRSVCEALAGYERFYPGVDPATAGTPPDQFVGRCYSEYVRSTDDQGQGPGLAGVDALDPIARETAMAHDRADELMREWGAGGAQAQSLWRKIRGWALAGQQATLARLGVRWDRVYYESAAMETVRSFVERGLEKGLFVRGDGEAVVYETDREEHASLKLLREDGFPTEHARVIGLFLDEQGPSAGADAWMVVCGDEWGTAGQVELEIATRLGDCPLADKVEILAHGMVTVAGSKMKSRDGQAVLIDDFLDELVGSPEVQRMLAEFESIVTPNGLIDLLVRGYFLSRRASKGLEFQWSDFVNETHNPAWSLARAWCRTHQTGDGPFDADRYRTAAMQVFQYRQLLARSTEGFQGTQLMKFVNGFSTWYLDGPSDDRLNRVVRSILQACLQSLGIPVPALSGR